ncbi:MAG: CorA family divalent cation transporter [Ilumatobacteraceae bacterium]
MAIEELSEPLTRFLRTCTDRIPEPVLPELHEASELLQRNAARTRSLSTLLDSTFDAAMAQLSIQQNEDMRKISAWVAIAAAPTMIAGIYGMNFTHFPELSWRFGYPSVLAVMAAIMLGLFRAFRRSGWL